MRYIYLPTGTEVTSDKQLPSVLFRAVTAKAEVSKTTAKAKASSRTNKTTK